MVMFGQGEKQLLSDKAKITKKDKKDLSISGMLYLTNVRLIFEQQTGLLSKKSETLFDIKLNGITNIGVEGLIGKKLVMEADEFISQNQGYRTAKYEISISNPNGWETQIRGSKQG